MSSWELKVVSFVLPKDGASESECEDAFAFDVMKRRFALADGATEAFDARAWARLLVDGWAASEENSLLAAEEFVAWLAAEGERLNETWTGRKMSWYGEEKSRAGSFATFVAVEFEEKEDKLNWRAIALGDACLVRCRDGRVCASFPIQDAAEFNTMPFLAPSCAKEFGLEQISARVRIESAIIVAGEVFYLLSDAIAAWFLKTNTENFSLAETFDELLRASKHDELTQFLRAEKLAGHLKDDDIGIIRISPIANSQNKTSEQSTIRKPHSAIEL